MYPKKQQLLNFEKQIDRAGKLVMTMPASNQTRLKPLGA